MFRGGYRCWVSSLRLAVGYRTWLSWVGRNDGNGVNIAITGENIEQFVKRLPIEKPPLARIDGIQFELVQLEPFAEFLSFGKCSGSGTRPLARMLRFARNVLRIFVIQPIVVGAMP